MRYFTNYVGLLALTILGGVAIILLSPILAFVLLAAMEVANDE